MTLDIGTRLGSYQILAKLGAGGMGEVYRARDTKLHREVAIKVLPGLFSSDQDGLARLEREARILATFNHPNIATVYGLEERPGLTAIVMELVEGEALDTRVRAKGNSRSTRRSRSHVSSSTRSTRRTSAASSIAISNPPTSSSRLTTSPRSSISVWHGIR